MASDPTFIAKGGGAAVIGFQATQDDGFVFHGFETNQRGNDPLFLIGGRLGGSDFGVYGYAGQGQDDGHKLGPEQNGYSQKAGVSGTSIH
jgi:hypothetical protein